MSSLDSLTPKTYPKIKQRVASCHTAEVISIQSLPASPHTNGTTDLRDGWWDPHRVWYVIDPIVLHFPIFRALVNSGAQSVDFPQIGENWGFSLLTIFSGAHMNPRIGIGRNVFQDIARRVAKLRENRPRDVEKMATQFGPLEPCDR